MRQGGEDRGELALSWGTWLSRVPTLDKPTALDWVKSKTAHCGLTPKDSICPVSFLQPPSRSASGFYSKAFSADFRVQGSLPTFLSPYLLQIQCLNLPSQMSHDALMRFRSLTPRHTQWNNTCTFLFHCRFCPDDFCWTVMASCYWGGIESEKLDSNKWRTL